MQAQNVRRVMRQVIVFSWPRFLKIGLQHDSTKQAAGDDWSAMGGQRCIFPIEVVVHVDQPEGIELEERSCLCQNWPTVPSGFATADSLPAQLT